MNIPVIAGAIVALFSLYMLTYAIRSYKKSLASEGWPTVNGKLVKVHLWGGRNVDGEMKEVEKLDVKYEYTVQEAPYTGTAVTYYTLVYPETAEFADRHPLNSNISVYYNPENPSESVLMAGPRKDNKRYSDIILGSLGVIVGVLIAVAGWLGVFA